MPVPLLDLRAQYAGIRDEVRAAFDRVADSQQLLLGPETQAFEEESAKYCGSAHALGCSSGTDALIMALMALGLGPGDQVITSAFTFFATGGSIARLGAQPVFADIDPVSFNLDPERLPELINEKTRAILPVHLYGQMSDMGAVLAEAQRRNLPVIEDAAQAIGAETEGRRAGSLGDIGCFSFYPTKNLGAFGDAGMVTTNNDELAEKLRMIRVHGGRERYYHPIIGGNFRIDALQSAILRIKLRRLDDWTAARQRNAARYNQMFLAAGVTLPIEAIDRLDENPGVILPMEAPSREERAVRLDDAPFAGHRHIYNQYVIRVGRRDAVMKALKAAQIGHEVYYPLPLHLQECFANLGYKRGDLPVSEYAAETVLALPIYPELTESQQQEVVDTVVRGLS